MSPMKRLLLPLILFLLTLPGLLASAVASKILIPMDDAQKNHLKAYGIAYWVLKTHDTEIDWLLNYRGGAFLLPQSPAFTNEMLIRGVTYEVISDADAANILAEIASPNANMDAVKLQKAPKVAVYSPKTKQPWDDAVTMVMAYAEIPYDVVFDEEVLNSKLPEYDWLHLHHEDFTGQFGKFFHMKDQPWYIAQRREAEIITQKFGYQ